MNKTTVYALFILPLAFFACQNGQQDTHDPTTLDTVALEAIQEDTYKEAVSKLSSDEFLGRKPFTKGDTLTVNYIQEQFKNLGLQPGNGDSYFQEVPLVEITSKPVSPTMTLKGEKGDLTINYLDDFVIGTKRLQDKINIASTELVFAGFGIVAPEYGWNDYDGLDVKGKTVVVLASDPGRYDKNLFKADTMTYYGRWTYKYEEAGRQGATGVLIIHETEAASYGWNVVRTGWSGPQLDMVTADNGASNAAFEGWISNETAKSLFRIAGMDLKVMDDAKKPGFKPVPLHVTTAVSLANSFRRSKSNNVIAKIEGSKRADETIIYTAHWDHLGVGEAVDGDSIYNGAVDNAAGVAALFEIAKAFRTAKVTPERTIVFMALTAEEEGLLGSAYYANNPIYPLNKTVANLNMDAFSPLGATKDVSIVGLGQTELEDYVEKSAAKFGRVVKGEGNPSSGGFYRSDHFNFVKKGVPGLFMGSGDQLISLDSTSNAQRKEVLSGRYHNVTDEMNEYWDFDGILADIHLFFDIGYTLSLEKTFPLFKANSEFKELGERRLAK
ncbi:M20/M25/M40 family metallo-hydrolase [Sphingobacterium alkalisoli]|uniref:M20/M25/M40 family metallo-hydrolase n=1 Tax=Sphingobacterium alkalisoli TaxID=1874115 RepID=A0A4U0GPM3_9SPHI|nr:M28 family metallopeptidase [Sphingobacterium alkalisoli]TJY60717.1 M20/M25/M40 family metallo-hydrolase [Sphingobacterium alkalisoli]GGH31527.1 hypothetical protein GCM10011418_44400 [Sphingobacterium alkalisoli]